MEHQKLELDLIISLQERGYDHDFILDGNEHIRCIQCDSLIAPNDFDIVEKHHCCGKVELDDSGPSLIYAIQLNNSGIKGILVSRQAKQPFSQTLLNQWFELFNNAFFRRKKIGYSYQ